MHTKISDVVCYLLSVVLRSFIVVGKKNQQRTRKYKQERFAQHVQRTANASRNKQKKKSIPKNTKIASILPAAISFLPFPLPSIFLANRFVDERKQTILCLGSDMRAISSMYVCRVPNLFDLNPKICMDELTIVQSVHKEEVGANEEREPKDERRIQTCQQNRSNPSFSSLCSSLRRALDKKENKGEPKMGKC
jgi:hypothetical protein